MSIPMMESAQEKSDPKRGFDFRPEPPRQAFSIIRVLEVLFRPATLISLGVLAVCVWLLVRHGA